MVWSFALCPDNAKQDPVVYGAEFGVVFLAKGPRTASKQEGLDCFGLYFSMSKFERRGNWRWIARNVLLGGKMGDNMT